MAFLKKYKYIVIAVVVLIVVGVGLYFMLGKNANNEGSENGGMEEAQDIQRIDPEKIGLSFTPKQNGEVINMQIENVEGISSFEYDLTYDAEVEDAGDTIVIARGVTGGPIEVNGKAVDLDIDLGTCSRNVCKYDTVVSDVTVILRINFTNGEVGGVETKVSLEE